MAFYFYCPKCGYEKNNIKKLPKGVVPNIRDGYGTPILHYLCPECNNLDAGYMHIRKGTMDEIIYYRSVIGLYQDIRGYAPLDKE